MSRSAVNFLVDSLLALNLLALLASASIVRLVFPRGSESAGWRVWGLDYNTWCDVHFGILGLFALTILIHVVLHWTWVCGFVTARLARRYGNRARINDSEKTLYGVMTLIGALTLLGSVLLGAHLAAAVTPI
ncbi:MAG: DUF4405 domain-containing protein [Planctomycetota bacterium]|jgi:hypothetical protein